MTRAALQALLSHWKRHPFQLTTLVLGIALATALWSGVQAINAEARKSYGEAAAQFDDQTVLVNRQGGSVSIEQFVELRRSGWQVSPIIEGNLPADTGRVRIIGIDPFTASRDAIPDSLNRTETAVLLGSDDVLLASKATAERLSQSVNRVEIAEGIAPGLVFTDIETAAELLGRTGFDKLVVAAEQPLEQSSLSEFSGLTLQERSSGAADLARLTDSFHLTLAAFGLLSFAVGLFIVNAAVTLAFEQRRPTFRTLRALGVPANSLVVLLIAEALIFAIGAGALGIALGYFIAAALLPDVAATLRGLYGANIEGQLTLSPTWWVSGLSIALIGMGLAACGTLIKVVSLAPLATAKPRAWLFASGLTIRVQAMAAVACLTVALCAGVFGSGVFGGFVLLGGLMLGAALSLPITIGGCLKLAGKLSKGVLQEWFWADTRQQLPGLSMALMALLLAIAANIGVGTMVGSFRSTFTGWLDQRLVSELYVSLSDESEVPAFEKFVEGRVDAILPIWHTEGEILGAQTEIYGVVDHPTYRDNWPLLEAVPNVWDQVNLGAGGLINEQLARRENLGPGDALLMPNDWSLKIVGVYSDYGNPRGQVILPLDLLTDKFDGLDRTEFGLRLPSENVNALIDDLQTELGIPSNQMVDQATLKAFSLSVFERTFAVTGALNILTLLIAAFAIVTSLLTLAAMRLPQLAPVWAIGLPRVFLALLEVVRSLVLAALTFVVAMPVGLALAWVLLAVVNVEAFGWRLPMEVFPSEWLRLFIFALLAAGLAALWPARVLAKKQPSDLVRVFAADG